MGTCSGFGTDLISLSLPAAGNYLVSAKQILAALPAPSSYSFCYLRVGNAIVDTVPATFDSHASNIYEYAYVPSHMQAMIGLQAPATVTVSCYNNAANTSAQVQNYNLYAIKVP